MPTIKNKSVSNATPGASFKSVNHTTTAGSNRLLLVSCAMNRQRNFTGCTYNGVAMQQILAKDLGGMSTRVVIFQLVDPPLGTFALRINFNGSVWNPISLYIQSFVNAQAGGNTLNLGGSSTPKTASITVSDNSAIFCMAVSQSVITGIQIPSGITNTPIVFTANINKQCKGALDSGFSAGAVSLRNISGSSNITMHAVEIKQSGPAQNVSGLISTMLFMF